MFDEALRETPTSSPSSLSQTSGDQSLDGLKLISGQGEHTDVMFLNLYNEADYIRGRSWCTMSE